MKYISETSLRDFSFCGDAEKRANKLTYEQLDAVEQMMIDDAPASGWSETQIHDFFWFEFDTICQWLGYADEEHLDADVSNEDIKEADDWEYNLDIEEMLEIAEFDESKYMSEDEELDEYRVMDDFTQWWESLSDIRQVEIMKNF